MNRDVNLLELGRRPWSSPTLDSGRRSRVEEREVDPESGDYGFTTAESFDQPTGAHGETALEKCHIKHSKASL